MSDSNTLFCPISSEKLNEHTVRLVAFLVVLVTLAGWFTASWVVFLLLAVDFGLRAFTTGVFSPVRQMAQWLTHRLSLGVKPTDAAPKKFAAGIGFVFSSFIALAIIFQWQVTAGALTAILLFCAFLESVFSFCVGCVVYAFLKRILPLTASK